MSSSEMQSYEVSINLYKDWLDTVKEVFRGSGMLETLTLPDDEIALAYFLQTASDEAEAEQQRIANEERLNTIEQTIRTHLGDVIVPDIRKRTGYEGHTFEFNWVFNQGEHIVEHRSSYRIPLEG
ncbi:hypothetical protein D3C84_996700 [compost metagenome]